MQPAQPSRYPPGEFGVFALMVKALALPPREPASPPVAAAPRAAVIEATAFEAHLKGELMDDQSTTAKFTARLRGKPGHGLLMCGLWVRLGFIGALALPAGLFALFEGEVAPLYALALAAGGAGLAVISWRRMRTLLDRHAPAVAAKRYAVSQPELSA